MKLFIRTFLCVLIGVSLCSSAQAAIAFVRTANGQTVNSTSVSATYGVTPTQNNLLVAISSNRLASTAPTTPAGWSVAITESNNAPGQIIYYKIAGASESATVTVSGYVTPLRLGLQIYEYSGVDTSSPLDQTASSSGTGTTVSSGTTAATTQANEVLVAGVIVSNTNSPPTTIATWTNSFTERNNFQNTSGAQVLRTRFGGADQIVSATGTYSTAVTANNSENWRGQIATFKEAAVAARRMFLVD